MRRPDRAKAAEHRPAGNRRKRLCTRGNTWSRPNITGAGHWSNLAAQPLNELHRLEARIEVHVFIASLAYCLRVTLARRLYALAPWLTPRSVLEKFAAIRPPRLPAWPLTASAIGRSCSVRKNQKTRVARGSVGGTGASDTNGGTREGARSTRTRLQIACSKRERISSQAHLQNNTALDLLGSVRLARCAFCSRTGCGAESHRHRADRGDRDSR